MVKTRSCFGESFFGQWAVPYLFFKMIWWFSLFAVHCNVYSSFRISAFPLAHERIYHFLCIYWKVVLSISSLDQYFVKYTSNTPAFLKSSKMPSKMKNLTEFVITTLEPLLIVDVGSGRWLRLIWIWLFVSIIEFCKNSPSRTLSPPNFTGFRQKMKPMNPTALRWSA